MFYVFLDNNLTLKYFTQVGQIPKKGITKYRNWKYNIWR